MAGASGSRSPDEPVPPDAGEGLRPDPAGGARRGGLALRAVRPLGAAAGPPSEAPLSRRPPRARQLRGPLRPLPPGRAPAAAAQSRPSLSGAPGPAPAPSARRQGVEGGRRRVAARGARQGVLSPGGRFVPDPYPSRGRVRRSGAILRGRFRASLTIDPGCDGIHGGTGRPSHSRHRQRSGAIRGALTTPRAPAARRAPRPGRDPCRRRPSTGRRAPGPPGRPP